MKIYQNLNFQFMSDNVAQKEELEVLKAIYPDILHIEGEHRISLSFRADIKLSIFLPDRYPSEEPPIYELSGPSLKTHERLDIQNILSDSYAVNIGVPVLYTWIIAVSDYLETLPREVQKCASVIDSSLSVGDATKDLKSNDLFTPEIKHGEVFTDRKSHFQAHLARINCKEQVKIVMNELLKNNKIARATHNMYAWRVREVIKGKEYKLHDCDDDGETGASSRMLELLNKMGAENVVVVVTRWYGGIHLGPDRFRIINNLTRKIVAEYGLDVRV